MCKVYNGKTSHSMSFILPVFALLLCPSRTGFLSSDFCLSELCPPIFMCAVQEARPRKC